MKALWVFDSRDHPRTEGGGDIRLRIRPSLFQPAVYDHLPYWVRLKNVVKSPIDTLIFPIYAEDQRHGI